MCWPRRNFPQNPRPPLFARARHVLKTKGVPLYIYAGKIYCPVCGYSSRLFRSPDHKRTPMIAKIVNHTINMHTMRPSVHPALSRLVTTSWLKTDAPTALAVWVSEFERYHSSQEGTLDWCWCLTFLTKSGNAHNEKLIYVQQKRR